MPTRIRYFDIARGLAMIAVILSHTIGAVGVITDVGGGWTAISNFCFSFHMPLFFILSGFFMHPERKFNWKRESRELLATYALTAGAVIIINTVHVAARRPDAGQTFVDWLAAALYGAGSEAKKPMWDIPVYIGAIWFLLALFWAHLFMHMLNKTKLTPVWILLLFLTGYLSAHWFWLPLSIQSGMSATLFVYLGWIAKKCDILDRLQQIPYMWIIPTVIWVFFIWKFSGFSMAMNQYGDNPLLAIIGSICGTLCILGIAMFIERFIPIVTSAFARIGRFTLPVLCMHVLEINTFPWPRIITALINAIGTTGAVLISFIGRTLFDFLLAWVLYHIPVFNELFFPSLQKKSRHVTA